MADVGGVMASWLLCSSPILSGLGPGYCFVILSKTLYCLRPGVLIGTEELNAGGNPAIAWYPIHGGVGSWLIHATETGISSSGRYVMSFSYSG